MKEKMYIIKHKHTFIDTGEKLLVRVIIKSKIISFYKSILILREVQMFQNPFLPFALELIT